MVRKKRADTLLVARGLAETQQKAQALILAGRVWSCNTRIDKAGQSVATDIALRVEEPLLPYVSRGGVKLAGALDHFKVSVSGKVCLDVGSSTGGFTHCLLQRGASLVMALDVGKAQLDWRLVQDPRVQRLEGINARYLEKNELPSRPDFVTVDVSFISLTVLLPAVLRAVSAPDTTSDVEMMALVKPQFEVPRGQVGAGGIVTDSAAQQAAVEKVRRTVAGSRWCVVGTLESPLAGAKGNREFFLYARNH